MGKDAAEAFEAARQVYEAADRALGWSVSALCFEGPEETLRQTANTQPALLATSVALLEAFKARGIRPDFVAGHSLGEYSALVAANVLDFADAIRLVRARGTFMEEAVPSGQGAMAATLGADRGALEALCRDISAAGTAVELANVNCPGQIVVSGTAAGVAQVGERAKEAGAKRVIPLDVSGPFHSSLMRPAAERLAARLDEVAFRDAEMPVVANVTASAVSEGVRLRELLVEQVYSPVLWEESVRFMLEQGVDTFVEIGSGTVLAGLIKKIDKSARVVSVGSAAGVNEAELG